MILRDDFDHAFDLQQRVDLAQPIRPQFVPIGQQDFEPTPLALSTLNHARSFAENITRGQCSTTDRSRQRRMNHLVTAGRRPSVRVNDLRGHFFTAK
jgi:hypothetical protein